MALGTTPPWIANLPPPLSIMQAGSQAGLSLGNLDLERKESVRRLMLGLAAIGQRSSEAAAQNALARASMAESTRRANVEEARQQQEDAQKNEAWQQTVAWKNQALGQENQQQQAEQAGLESFRRALPTGGEPVSVPNQLVPGLFPNYEIPQPATTGQDYGRLAMQHLQPQNWADADRLIGNVQGQSLGPPQFAEDESTGSRFAFRGGMMMPSGVNPAKSSQAVQIFGPGGEQLGFGLPDRSGVRPLRTGEPTGTDEYQAIAREKAIYVSQLKDTLDPNEKTRLMDLIDGLDVRMKALRGTQPVKPGNAKADIEYRLIDGKLQQVK